MSKPRSGQVFDTYMRTKYNFKYACRKFKSDSERQKWSVLADRSNADKFWTKVRSLRGDTKIRGLFDSINGATSSPDIACAFANAFEAACVPWDPEAVKQENRELDGRLDACNLVCDDSSQVSFVISSSDVQSAIRKLSCGKSPDIRGLSAEHLKNANVSFEISCILTAMVRASVYPSAFCESLFFPLLKDTSMDKADSSSYRGIAVAPVLSKVFEAVFAIRNADYLKTHRYQYGYKQDSSCGVCAFDLLSQGNRYCRSGSPVHLLFVDASKAFDKVVHPRLCQKLLDRGISPVEVSLFRKSLEQSRGRVKVDGCISRSFELAAGVRQGSLLGGTMWSVYLDDLLGALEDLGVGCQPISAFAYADDICLAAPTVAGLKNMAAVLEEFAVIHQIKLNPSKSWAMTCGSTTNASIELSGKVVKDTCSIKYLGFNVCLTARRRLLAVDDASVIRKFFGAANAILGIPNCSHPLIRAKLINVFATPIVDYLLQLSVFVPMTGMKRLQIAVNKVAKRACGLHRGCSSEIVCAVFGRPPLSVRSGQLRILRGALDGLVVGDSTSVAVVRSRLNGVAARVAARRVFAGTCTEDHATRANIIRALLATPDNYSRAMAYNVSTPSVLRV